MTALAPASARPPDLGRRWQNTLAALRNGCENDGTWRPATAAQLTLINARALILRAALIPGPMQRIRLAVSFLLSQWHPGRALTRDRADAIVQNYTSVLEPLPAWAVESAALLLVPAQVPGVHPDFAPSSARVYSVARDELVPYRAELDTLILIERASAWQKRV